MTHPTPFEQQVQAQPQASPGLPIAFSTEEAAAILRCESETLQAALRAGRVPGLKFGREWTIPTRAFIDYINELALAEAAEKRSKQPVRHPPSSPRVLARVVEVPPRRKSRARPRPDLVALLRQMGVDPENLTPA